MHVGAHLAEEAGDYQHNGIHNVWWIEANASLIPKIQKTIRNMRGHQVIQALVYDKDGVDLGFNITNLEGMSSSILEFGTHAKKAPHCRFVEQQTLTTSTLDTLTEKHGINGCNLLMMDLQGAELYALKGGETLLEDIDYVMTEINVDELYEDCVRLWELDAWLSERGFLRVETSMAENHVMWGDALYIRKPTS